MYVAVTSVDTVENLSTFYVENSLYITQVPE
jgi:hypothetical protein